MIHHLYLIEPEFVGGHPQIRKGGGGSRVETIKENSSKQILKLLLVP